MIASELAPNQLFTSASHSEWGVFKFLAIQDNVALALCVDEEARSWLPDPDRPVWLPADGEVFPL